MNKNIGEIEIKKSRQKRDETRKSVFKTAMRIACNPNVSAKTFTEAYALGTEVALATLLDETLDDL